MKIIINLIITNTCTVKLDDIGELFKETDDEN